MLIPLTRKTFEEIVPIVATAAQFAHNWGKLSDVLRRVLIAVVGMFVVVLLKALFLREGFDEILLISGITVGLYWLWSPILTASLNNLESRRYSYCGLWKGEVLDLYVTEELVGTQETVNQRGDLVVKENRERCLNLEVGDELGFLTSLRVPLKKVYRAIDIGDTAELLVFSNRADLGRIAKTSDIYIPDHNLWVSDYPYVRRDAFVEVSRRVNSRLETGDLPDVEPPKRGQSPRSEAASDYEQEYPADLPFTPEPPRRKRIPRTEADLRPDYSRYSEDWSDRGSYRPSRSTESNRRGSSRRRPARDR